CGPLEKMGSLQRLSVFVYTKESNIEIVARVGEVVVITAEESDLLFGSKYETNVRIFLKTIEPIFASAVERNDFAAQSCFIGRRLLDRRSCRFALFIGFLVRCSGLYGALNLACYVFIRREDIDFEIRRTELFDSCAGEKALFRVVPIFRRDFL